ncbi:hypothetical protein BHM03_00042359 [Ensete ventricosum]|nr:hypothetical protein BHM03_00042359 [Ensete ventricosum]
MAYELVYVLDKDTVKRFVWCVAVTCDLLTGGGRGGESDSGLLRGLGMMADKGKWTEKGRRWYVVDVARLKTAAEGVNRPSKEEDEQPEEQERIRGSVLLTAVGGGRSTRHCPPEEEGHGCMAATVAGDGEGYIARDNDYSSG